jgi:hypothetical protein
MSHYAKVEKGKVIKVIVAEEEFFETFVDDTPGEWVKTSYNTKAGEHTEGGTPLRKNYAGVDWNYDGVGFFPPQPFNSWTLNDTTYLWEPPVDYPSDYDGINYTWNETNKRWVETTE